MNKNNGLLIGIAAVIVVAAGIAVALSATRKNDTVPEPAAAPVVDTTPSAPEPVAEAPYVEPRPTMTPSAAAPIIETPVKKPSSSQPTGRAPGVTTLGTSSLSSGAVVLHGNLSTNGSESYFSFQYGTTSNFGLSTRFAPVSDSNANVEVTLAAWDLSPGTVYYYRLNAQNESGKSQGETKSFATPALNGAVAYVPAQPSAPSANPLAPGVTTGEASSISRDSAVANGRLVTHGVETYFSFQYGTTASLGMETRVAPIDGSNGSSDVTLALYNLMPGTAYYYKLHAHNQYGISYDGVRQFTTAQ